MHFAPTSSANDIMSVTSLIAAMGKVRVVAATTRASEIA